LTGVHDCDHPPTTVSARPEPAGLLISDSDQRESTRRVMIPPGATVTVDLGFGPAALAYENSCDRFAFRVTFVVEGELAPLTVVAETKVTRVWPREGP